MRFQASHAALVMTLLCLPQLLAGCVTTTEGMINTKKTPTGEWLEPSPVLRQQIEDQAERLPWTHGSERVEQIHWFATVGEPAYPKLLQLVADQRPGVAGSALAALGATRDSRLVTSLRQIPVQPTEAEALRYERARTFLRLGDWRDVPILIDGLRNESMMMRALCSLALYEATGERLGYDAKDPALIRDQAVLKWEAWWKDREREGILNSSY